MSALGFAELWSKLVEGDESVLIEAKRATEAGKSIAETISAFCNEPGANGGYVLFGVAIKEKALFPDWEIVGVPNPDQLQSALASQCRETFSIPVRPEIVLETVHGKNVIVMYVPEANPHNKPVYIKNRGSEKGAFRRIGPTDQICTDGDLEMFFQSRGQKSYDENIVRRHFSHRR